MHNLYIFSIRLIGQEYSYFSDLARITSQHFAEHPIPLVPHDEQQPLRIQANLFLVACQVLFAP